MSFKAVVAIIIIAIFVISYVFMILRIYFSVKRIEMDNEKLKQFLTLSHECFPIEILGKDEKGTGKFICLFCHKPIKPNSNPPSKS